MKLEVGQVVKGWKVERARESAELGGVFYELSHEKAGSSLCWLDNGDANKLFCVGFKTLPENSTGVFHILEHSVLCGSKKYPVKEPFVDLLKSSMNTFLNAMTFQDKTIYPVSSRNERDFLNLTEVYLDAVFAPRCVVDPNAFRQEGWHLEIGEDGKPFINGVVYNEMKGATSGIEDIIEEGVNSMLFTDNCYGYNSGGDPAVIPELSYEQYCAMYHKYYHPSNARIFLDGAVPLEATLELINEYVDGAEKEEATHPIPMQAMKPGAKTVYYSLGEEEEEAGRATVAYASIVASYADKRRLMMADVLCSLLADTNEAPLKRAILDAGLAEDVDLSCENYIEQAKLVLTARNTDAEKAPAIREKAEEVIKDLLEKGLDKSLLTAHLNRFAFRIKDTEEPAGLIRCIMSYQSSLYGGDPMLYLENDADIEAMRAEIGNGGFDRLLAELFDFDNMSLLTVLPSKTYGEQLLKEEAARAEAIYAALSEEEREELTAMNDRLHAWQAAEDAPEDTAKLPVLPLSEVSPDPIRIESEVTEHMGVKVMYHPVKSNGITHINLYFNVSDLRILELPAAGVMAALLTKLPTEKHTVAELQKEIKTYIGHLGFEVKASMRTPQKCTPYFAVSCDVLDENLEKAEELIAEILLTTRFDEPERIREVMLQIDEATKQRAIMAGHTMGLAAVTSHYLSSMAVTEAVSGYTFREFVKGLSRDFEGHAQHAIAIMERVRDGAFARSRLTVGVTATKAPCLKGLVSAFPEGGAAADEVHYDSPVPERFGVRIPAQANFAEKGIIVPELDGSMRVAANIIGLSFLWNRVRVQGGAYGVGLRVDDNGAICHYTYRDPSPARSIGVFSEESAFIREFCEGGEDLTKFIISAVGNTEPLRSPADEGAKADMDLLCGKTYEDAKKRRAEMLATDRDKLLSLCPVLDDCAANGCVCVVGSDAGLNEFNDLTVVDA